MLKRVEKTWPAKARGISIKLIFSKLNSVKNSRSEIPTLLCHKDIRAPHNRFIICMERQKKSLWHKRAGVATLWSQPIRSQYFDGSRPMRGLRSTTDVFSRNFSALLQEPFLRSGRGRWVRESTFLPGRRGTTLRHQRAFLAFRCLLMA